MDRRRRLLWLAALSLCFACLRAAVGAETGRVVFGVVADVQYADRDDSGSRHYRASLEKLSECVKDLNSQGVAFTIQLGDVIDRGKGNLEQVLGVFNQLTAPKYHVLGNHDCLIGRAALLPALKLETPYYSFRREGWRFIVLDTVDVSPESGWPEGSAEAREGERWLARLKQAGRPNAEPWNGGVGKKQLGWLEQQLREATAAEERVIVFGHIPILAEASAEWALLYNHEEVAKLLEAHPCVAAYLCGHEHGGGYALHNGVHYLTLQGMVESRETAYAIITLSAERLGVGGVGSVPSRELPLRPRAAVPKQGEPVLLTPGNRCPAPI